MSTDRQFHLDAETSDSEKRRREEHFHTVEVPRLRLIGFALVTALVLLREAFVSESHTDPVRIAVIVVTYRVSSLGSCCTPGSRS
ncbi:MAG: hypothetical protein DMF97_22400 [Acidobacteria bacterium]|nr:MAG: hypothetical protein DMF97_22400 [Acidobacteriota bacterium]